MLNIIHETKDIIIVNKPAGQLSQGAKGFDLDPVSYTHLTLPTKQSIPH